jgi:hypothetical protein
MAATVSQAFTRFMFIVARDQGESFLTRLRAAGVAVARGFFNDFDADGARESQSHEAIQFLVATGWTYPDSAISAADYVVQVTGKYRPRLLEVENELRRRLGDLAVVRSLEGVERTARYTSAEMDDFANRPAAPRRSGRHAAHAIILPLSKTAAWWAMPAMERQTFFYPHIDGDMGCQVPGHAKAAEQGIHSVFRRLYHNPDGYQRPGEYDFITYFECAPEHVETFDRIHRALKDTSQNPEWRFVREGPLWKGKRVLKW